MRVDLCGLHARMPQEFLHRPDVVTGLDQVRGEAVA
jgi:hypothetical protein